MRIVAIADTHMFHTELALPEGDVLVHAGDLCLGGDLEEFEVALGWLRCCPHRRKVVVAGNHDRVLQPPRRVPVDLCGAGLTYLEDDAAEIDGVRFWGSPWQPQYLNWAFCLPRGEALAEKWALIPDRVDVLVTHGPPRGFGDRGGDGERQGCDDLLRRVMEVRPRLHIFGHMHWDGGVWEREGVVFVNVTTNECERSATVIDLDERTGAVEVLEVPPPGTGPRWTQ